MDAGGDVKMGGVVTYDIGGGEQLGDLSGITEEEGETGGTRQKTKASPTENDNHGHLIRSSQLSSGHCSWAAKNYHRSCCRQECNIRPDRREWEELLEDDVQEVASHEGRSLFLQEQKRCS